MKANHISITSSDLKYSRLDFAFSHFLVQRTPFVKKQKEDFEILCAKLSFQQTQGHSCIHVDTIEQALISASGLASDGDFTPLILEQDRLYLHRYWFYENRLSIQINGLLTQNHLYKNLNSILERYFTKSIDEIDWQKEAVIKAITNRLCIITGGPGTGKTSAIVKILAILQELAAIDDSYLHIAMAAPTGKATMRLQESINNNKKRLLCSESIKQQIPKTASTLHRLLGSRPHSPFFKHHSGQPLIYDLVIIDEASMIDLALMSKLVDALKPNSSLILLGDKDQLASVESGAVLADLTAALPEQTIELKKSYRFQGKIKALADAVNSQDKEEAWKILMESEHQVSILEDDPSVYAAKKYNRYLQLIKSNAEINTIFMAFNQFQILCSNRHGNFGTIEINQLIENNLNRQNKIQRADQWYVGRPIMVTENNSSMNLYNGDIGICMNDSDTGKLAVFFQSPDGKIHKITPARIPAHDTAYAMTIHKSQGSEFDECLCILPDRTNPILSKELIYTAITRAKKTLRIHSSYSVFCEALSQKINRSGGFYEKLILKN